MEQFKVDVDSFNKSTTTKSYPNIVLSKVNSTTPVVVNILESGDVQLICEYNGVRKAVPKRISLSAYNAEKLLRTHGSFVLNLDETKSVAVASITDYIEVFEWTL